MSKSKRILSLLLFSVFFLSVSISAYAGNSSAAVLKTVGKVTGYEKITWGISTGRYYVNGTHAFCAQYNKSWPLVGTEITSILPCENENLRKILYYGYHGPQNTLGTDARAHVLTAIAVSDANIGERETGASSKYDVFYWDIVNNPSKYPSPPRNFKAYMAITKGEELQNLAFYEVEKTGYVKAIKSSSNPEITKENSCYSLTGAQYSIYRDVSLSEASKVGTLTTDENGNSNTLELVAGTYYAYETVAPKGYKKSEQITEFTILPNESVTLQFSDEPYTGDIEKLLEKVDKETGKNKAQGLATLKGAEFAVQFYAGLWGKDISPSDYTEQPQRTWRFKTDEDGKILYKEEYLVSGDKLYDVIPLGTLVIQEVVPSAGYLLNETVFVREITKESIYTTLIVEEEYDRPAPYDLVIQKSNFYGEGLSWAEFTLYSDVECRNESTKGITDENGVLRLSGLEMERTYYLKETVAPEGYEKTLDEEGKERVYEITAIYNPVTEEFICYVDGNTYTIEAEGEITLSETAENREVRIHITNDIKYRIPETGSYARPAMILTGIALCSISIYLTNQEKRRKKL